MNSEFYLDFFKQTNIILLCYRERSEEYGKFLFLLCSEIEYDHIIEI